VSEVLATEVQALEDNHYRNGIWWLASYPKSGSTWIRMFVNCALTRFPVNLNAQYQYCLGDNFGNLYQAASVMPLSTMGVREVIYLRPAALINALAMANGRDVCLKTHHANAPIEGIQMCPEKLTKGALYVVRDPRDVVLSFARHMGQTVDEAIASMANENMTIRQKGNLLFHHLSSWSQHVASWLTDKNPIKTACVRYEDMLQNPDRVFWKILDALGLREHVDDAAYQFALDQTQFEQLKRVEQQTGFRELGCKQATFFNTGRAGQWRSELIERQVALIERQHEGMMRELGYELVTK